METVLIAILISIILTTIFAGRRSQPPSPTVIYLPPPAVTPQRSGLGCLPLIMIFIIILVLLRFLMA